MEETPSTPKRYSASSVREDPPAHLSEFISLVSSTNNHQHNNNSLLQSPISTSSTTSRSTNGRINLSFMSTSSNLSNYANSEFDEDSVVITLKDILRIIKKYQQVIVKAQNYSNALSNLLSLSSEFGASIEELTKLKGCDEVGEDLYRSSGLQYVNSNYDAILLETLKKKFVVVLREKLEQFRRDQLANDEEFQSQLKTKLQNLQIKEIELKKFNKQKRKNLNMNLNKYKFNLISITNELNSIEEFKRLNYENLLDQLQKFHREILFNLSGIIRLQLEINETILKKLWSGGGLDLLMSKFPDPYSLDLHDQDDNGELGVLGDKSLVGEEEEEDDDGEGQDEEEEEEEDTLNDVFAQRSEQLLETGVDNLLKDVQGHNFNDVEAQDGD